MLIDFNERDEDRRYSRGRGLFSWRVSRGGIVSFIFTSHKDPALTFENAMLLSASRSVNGEIEILKRQAHAHGEMPSNVLLASRV